ncbi:hypothetical protein [Streptantibioticus ferralitis]|uniref:Uncharacterized protein n=1 Tax=Streptantibioticus ferralitis TaxID=236510 RepID=A0ABT5Z3U3_9ACTN|nr:hypothetical protein [Streptantibioticus ferralitis]MDF2258369.1 hypothetical protein [Streptantibioticus ferralitis]
MEVGTAITLVNGLIYKPGWTFTATDHTSRFEGTIKVRVEYPARNSNRDQAADGYPEEITTYAEFPLLVGDCPDDLRLYQRILAAIAQIEIHEAREFLRVPPTSWAPFHPHRIDGMKNWNTYGDTDPMVGLYGDLQFGIA